jgi:hypothetical protein
MIHNRAKFYMPTICQQFKTCLHQMEKYVSSDCKRSLLTVYDVWSRRQETLDWERYRIGFLLVESRGSTSEHGSRHVLRLPPYHCDLNPMGSDYSAVVQLCLLTLHAHVEKSIGPRREVRCDEKEPLSHADKHYIPPCRVQLQSIKQLQTFQSTFGSLRNY